ncbi:hypothetical protein RYA05_01550 [Pseudomonas syringae pv. actinidiae]|nr:hypothetical protein [Pseudomonas syringae pv. actinidiae]
MTQDVIRCEEFGMKPYAPQTNKGRTVSIDDISHRTADQPRRDRVAAAKSAAHGARQEGKITIDKALAESTGAELV